MRCWVKSRNERNPYSLLVRKDLSEETAGDEPEEGGDYVKSSWPLRPGRHTCYNGLYRGLQNREVEPIPKRGLSWDRSLQLDSVNAESLVIADQHAAVTVFLSLVHTARQATKAGGIRSRRSRQRQAPKMKPVMGTKS